jgi:hypothetical protein
MAYKAKPLGDIARKVIDGVEENVDANQRLIVGALAQIALKDYSGAVRTLETASNTNHIVGKAVNLMLSNDIKGALKVLEDGGEHAQT